MASHLLILGEREALAWVLRKEKMAFPAYRSTEVSRLQRGDDLLLYTTRGCFHNPGRDRGRLIGLATATSGVERLRRPVHLAGREFSIGCSLALESLVPLGRGPELAPLVPRLASFPNKAAWPARLRRPLLTLRPADATLLRQKVAAVAGAPADSLAEYLAAGSRVVV